MADLRDEVVVIPGGSAGVGRATAEAFAREGVKVAVLARGRERLDTTVQELQRLGAQAMSVPVDVAEAQQVENAAQRVEEQLGPIGWYRGAAAVAVITVAAAVGGALALLCQGRRRGEWGELGKTRGCGWRRR